MTLEIPLLTASKGYTPEMNNIIVQTILMGGRVLSFLPMINLNSGFTWSELEEVTGAGGDIDFRALNEDYSNSYGEVKEKAYGVKQLGGALKIEKKMERQFPGTSARQLRMRLKALSMFVDSKFINGDADTSEKEFDGLKKILGDSGDHVTIASGGLTINDTAAHFQDFMDLLDEAFRGIMGSPNAILCSDVMYDSITSGARKVGADVLGTTKDFLGDQVYSYRGVPFISLKNDNTGTAILPFTETLGTTNTASLYVVRLDDLDGVAGITTNGLDILPDEDNLFIRDVIDFDMGVRVATHSAMRVAGLKVA